MIPIRAKLKEKPVTFGSWAAIGSPIAAEIFGKVGYDWLIIDTQHGGASEATLAPLLQALDSTGTPGLVRVNWLDSALIMRACDLGAAGVVVPMVSTPEAAREAVEACRYPPHGIRSFGPLRGFNGPGTVTDDPLCLVMIETVEAMENLDAIAATPGLDGLLVGPVDLALSMGHELSFEMPDEVLNAVERVAKACNQHDLIAASVAVGAGNAEAQLKRGITFLASGGDQLFLAVGAGEDLRALRQISTGAGKSS